MYLQCESKKVAPLKLFCGIISPGKPNCQGQPAMAIEIYCARESS